jgi:hypothetical protein
MRKTKVSIPRQRETPFFIITQEEETYESTKTQCK